jgi:hypothetical protein
LLAEVPVMKLAEAEFPGAVASPAGNACPVQLVAFQCSNASVPPGTPTAQTSVGVSSTDHVRNARSVHRPVLAAPTLLRPAPSWPGYAICSTKLGCFFTKLCRRAASQVHLMSRAGPLPGWARAGTDSPR